MDKKSTTTMPHVVLWKKIVEYEVSKPKTWTRSTKNRSKSNNIQTEKIHKIVDLETDPQYTLKIQRIEYIDCETRWNVEI